jgi:superfamily II DNA/RNA helicase
VLSPALHQAFDEMQFPNGFTDIQYYGIPEVLKRKDTILASQTGRGASPSDHTQRVLMA